MSDIADIDTTENGSGALIAKMNYIVDNGVKPVHDIFEDREEHTQPGEYEERVVSIQNGRPLRDSFTLDQNGFAFLDHVPAVTDFYDADVVKRIYYPEVKKLILEQSGASKVMVFDHTFRLADDALREEKMSRKPVKRVHNDYTDESGAQRVRDLLPPDEAEARLKKRFMIIQVWRPIRAAVEADPLAIGDARTLSPENFILVTRRYEHRTAYVYHISYDPRHTWYYFPDMTPDEALMFKVFDSDPDAPARYTAHSAFDDPNSPPDARPRESIEARALAFFD
ncbi:MAG: CmcJ/NvfI family oxidoreductase [Rhodospirillaceae bacterium]|jgi:hypothetical protein